MSGKANTNRKKSYKGIVFLRNLDPAVKRAFKAACARRGQTMSQNIEQHMLDTVRENEPNEVKKLRLNERKTT